VADPDPQLKRTQRQFDTTGLRILLAGGVLAAIGALVAILGAGGLGAGIMWLAVVPTVIGLALLVVGGVSGWTARRRPFA
jgi:hypothetical protein